MKVGILTYFNVPNFGANLQALSTYFYFKNQGYSVALIDWIPADLQEKLSKDQIKHQEHYNFIETYFSVTERCNTIDDVRRVIIKERIEVVVVGSDAILQHHSLISRIVFPSKKIVGIKEVLSDRLYPNPFWGCFKDEMLSSKLIMMSASSQDSSYKTLGVSLRKKMKSDLLKFEYISVRDTWTKKMVEFITNSERTPIITPDPVFAFNQNIGKIIPSKSDILEKFGLPDEYILISFRTPKKINVNWLHSLKENFKENNVACVAFPMPNGITFEHPFNKEISLPLNPLDWYGLIKYSNGYIGENMHPIIVALHNHVPFFSFDTYGECNYSLTKCNIESSKIYDLLKNADLLEYYCNVNGRFFDIPEPSFVFERVLYYDKRKSKCFSDKMYTEYHQMMTNIIEII